MVTTPKNKESFSEVTGLDLGGLAEPILVFDEPGGRG